MDELIDTQTQVILQTFSFMLHWTFSRLRSYNIPTHTHTQGAETFFKPWASVFTLAPPIKSIKIDIYELLENLIIVFTYLVFLYLFCFCLFMCSDTRERGRFGKAPDSANSLSLQSDWTTRDRQDSFSPILRGPQCSGMMSKLIWRFQLPDTM